jgi:putative ABC transport system permease protein
LNVARIAVRNISRQKKRSFLLGGAIAFGVMIITLIGSFSRGIAGTASANITDIFGGHLYISGEELTETGRKVSVIRDRAALADALLLVEDQIAASHVRSRTIGEIIFGSRSTHFAIEGIDWRDEPKLIQGLKLVAGEVSRDFNAQALAITASTADEIGVEVGEEVLVRTSTVTGQQTVADFKICAIIDDDTAFGFRISSGYADRSYLNAVIGIADEEFQSLNIALDDPGQAGPTTDQLLRYFRSLGLADPKSSEEGGLAGIRARMEAMRSLMGGSGMFGSSVEDSERWSGTRFSVLNINDLMEGVTSLVNVLNTITYVIFLVLIVITMVGLLNTFRMILIERTREIGTMRAMGMQQTGVRNIFLAEALVLSLGGGAGGFGPVSPAWGRPEVDSHINRHPAAAFSIR